MYYVRARWYRLNVGRFLTAEKIEGEDIVLCECIRPQSRQTLNRVQGLYLYSDVDPIDRVDPSGRLSRLEWTVLAVSAVGFYQSWNTISVFTRCVGAYLAAQSVALVTLHQSPRGGQGQLVVGPSGLFDGIIWPIPGVPAPWTLKAR